MLVQLNIMVWNKCTSSAKIVSRGKDRLDINGLNCWWGCRGEKFEAVEVVGNGLEDPRTR